MRFLHSIHTVNPARGGVIESVIQTSAILIRRGHIVEIVSLDAPGDPWVRDCPVVVHALGPGRGSYGYSPRFSAWIKARRSTYDTVIVHGLWQYHSFGVWRAVAGSSTPYFVFPHGMLDPWFKRKYPVKHFKKLLYWPWAEYRVLRDSKAVLFTSEEERRLARESFSLYRCREVVVSFGTAAPATDLARARKAFFDAFPNLRGERFVLFLGRLHEKKGCDLLIEAFDQVRNSSERIHLVLAGPCDRPDYLRHLQQRTASRNGMISFPGMLTGDVKWGAFSAAEVFVLPSHQENFGIAVAEALACGTPVLISNKVNIWREIEADGAGYVENDDLVGTTNLLKRWLATPPRARSEMRENAQKSFANRFEVERATDSLLAAIANP